MKKKKAEKTRRWNFKVAVKVDDELRKISQKSGRTMTKTIEDLISGERLFANYVEDFISEESRRTGKPRWQIVEDAVLIAAKAAQFGYLPLVDRGLNVVQTIINFGTEALKNNPLSDSLIDAEDIVSEARNALAVEPNPASAAALQTAIRAAVSNPNAPRPVREEASSVQRPSALAESRIQEAEDAAAEKAKPRARRKRRGDLR